MHEHLPRAPRLRRFGITLVFAVALSAGALGADAASRDASAKVRARVMELVNTARAKSRRCGSERYPAAPPLRGS